MIDTTVNTERIERDIRRVKREINCYKILAIIIIIFSTILLCIFWKLFYYSINKEYNYLLDIGNISGGIISSLFSLAGLLLVYVAFLGQKQQLLYQQLEMVYNRVELDLTRQEIKGQQIEMKLQNETLLLQNFENIFFQLITNYQQHINLYYFINQYSKIAHFVKEFMESNSDNNFSNEHLSKLFHLLLDKHKYGYSYINQVRTICKVVEESRIENKSFYIDIFKNILSENEKKYIFLIINYSQDISQETKDIILKYDISGNYVAERDFRYEDHIKHG